MQVRGKPLGPFGNEPRELACFLVVAAERPVGRDPGRTEENDGVVDPLAAERLQRRKVFGQDAQRARLVAVDEVRVPVGERAVVRCCHRTPSRPKSMKPRSTSMCSSFTCPRWPPSNPLDPFYSFRPAAGGSMSTR